MENTTEVFPRAKAGNEPSGPARETFAAPVSFGQSRLLFLQKLQPDSPICNLPVAVRLEGPLAPKLLGKAVNQVFLRHESLRTWIDCREGRPCQRIASSPALTLPVVDLPSLPRGWREEEARRLIAEEARKPFDLSAPPLLRVKLLRLSDDHHIFLLTVHRIISDELSIGVFFRELACFYQSGGGEVFPELASSPVQYADFSAWQSENLHSLDTELAWWKKQLGGRLPVLELPAPRPRPSVQTYRGAVEALILPSDLHEKLQALGRRENATIFMTLLAAFQALLHRYTGHEDLLVGSSVSGRDRAEIEEAVGLFSNTVVLRGDASGNPSFVELLRRARQTTIDALANGAVPFARVVEELKPERNLSHPPLFQVMFSLETDPLASVKWPGMRLAQLPTDNGATRYDLTLVAVENAGGLAARAEYNQSLFDAPWIRRLLAHYRALLESVVADPTAPLSRLSLLSASERHQLLVEWNRTEVAWNLETTVAGLIEAQAARTPDATAVKFEDRSLTYQELDEQASRLAHFLRGAGLRPGDLAGVCLERSLDMVTTVLGVLKAGGSYLPLDPSYPKERLEFMLRDSGARVVITHAQCLETVPRGEFELVNLDEKRAAISRESRLRPAATIGPSSRAYVIYTSGSTGKPKGVQVSHGALANFLHSMRREPGLLSTDSLLAVTTLSFDIAGLELYLPLTVGARVVLAGRAGASDGMELSALIAREGITVMQATPATWRLLLDSGWAGSGSLRVLCGGEPLPLDLAGRLLERCSELWNLYGPTETTVWSAAARVERGGERIVVGRPIANTQFYILDRHAEPVPAGVAGELFIGGAGLSLGYLNRPELTAEKFVSNPFGPSRLYRTGDLARWRPDGTVELLGRIDNQVKIRGYRIELGEIEAALASFPDVREAVVVARERAPGDLRLTGYLTSYNQATVSLNELRQFLREKLPAYMVPAAFVILERLPLTPNGKVDRRALPLPENERGPTGPETTPPRPGLEQKIAKVWAEVLGAPPAGPNDNFFDLGGHSLGVVQVQTRLREEFGLSVSAIKLFEYPTIRLLAAYLDDERTDQALVQTVNDRARKQHAAQARQKGLHPRINL